MNDLGNRVSVYQPEQAGLIFPRELQTNDPAELRQHRKRHLVGACRAFARWGLDYGFAGHLTIRDPEFQELYWTNPMAVHFAQVKLSNLILVDHDGAVVEGDHAVNQAGFVLHIRTFSRCAMPTRSMAPPTRRRAGRLPRSPRTRASSSRTMR